MKKFYQIGLMLLLILCGIVLLSSNVFAEEGDEPTLEVIDQPYTFPDKKPPTFTIKTYNIPEDATVTYQWYIEVDGYENQKILPIEGATEPTYTLPCYVNPFGLLPNAEFCCEMTVNGKKTFGDHDGELISPGDFESGFLIGNEIVRPGETKNLYDGNVSMSADGHTLTLDNVNYVSDDKETNIVRRFNTGCFLTMMGDPGQRTINVKGNNTLTSEYNVIRNGKEYEENSQKIGEGLTILSGDNVTITGETLNLSGGTSGLVMCTSKNDSADLTVTGKDTVLNTTATNDYETPFEDPNAIYTNYKINVTDKATLNAESYGPGAAILSGDVNAPVQLGGINVSDATINATNYTEINGQVTGGDIGGYSCEAISVTGYNVVLDKGGTINAKVPNFNISSSGVSTGAVMVNDIEATSQPAFKMMDGSTCNVDIFETDKKSDDLAEANGMKIIGGEGTEIDASTLNINVGNGKRLNSARGIWNENSVNIKNGSDVKVNVSTKGGNTDAVAPAYGILTNRFAIDNSNLSIDVKNQKTTDDIVGIYRSAVEAENFPAENSVVINEEDNTHGVKITTTNGIAIQNNVNEQSSVSTPFDANYKAFATVLKGNLPENTVISTGSTKNTGVESYTSYETPYNAADTSKPLSALSVGLVKPDPTPTPTPTPNPTPTVHPTVNPTPNPTVNPTTTANPTVKPSTSTKSQNSKTGITGETAIPAVAAVLCVVAIGGIAIYSRKQK